MNEQSAEDDMGVCLVEQAAFEKMMLHKYKKFFQRAVGFSRTLPSLLPKARPTLAPAPAPQPLLGCGAAGCSWHASVPWGRPACAGEDIPEISCHRALRCPCETAAAR